MSNNYEPELHSCGQSSPYIDPDYGALLSTDQLPSLSTIGRGPRGFGLFANANETTDGYFTFDIVSDVTGESILTSPNLHSGVISVKQRPDDLVPGASSFLDITVTRGEDVATYEVELPTGSDGGRVYLWNGTKEKHPSWTYRIPTDELHFDGEAVWPSKPDPRPNDIVMMTIKDTHKYYLAVAHVVDNVGLDTIVTATTFCPVPVPYIGDNGHWYVDGEDTGVEAQGPKGDKAQMRIGTVTTLVPGKQAEASIALVDEEDNIYELSLRIPEGRVGSSLDIGNAYIVDDVDAAKKTTNPEIVIASYNSNYTVKNMVHFGVSQTQGSPKEQMEVKRDDGTFLAPPRTFDTNVSNSWDYGMYKLACNWNMKGVIYPEPGDRNTIWGSNAVDTDPPILVCSDYVCALLRGVTYEGSAIVNGVGNNAFGQYHCSWDDNLGTVMDTDRLSYTSYELAYWLATKGRLFFKADSWLNIMPGDLLFTGNPTSNPDSFLNIGHCQLVIACYPECGYAIVTECGNTSANFYWNMNGYGFAAPAHSEIGPQFTVVRLTASTIRAVGRPNYPCMQPIFNVLSHNATVQDNYTGSITSAHPQETISISEKKDFKLMQPVIVRIYGHITNKVTNDKAIDVRVSFRSKKDNEYKDCCRMRWQNSQLNKLVTSGFLELPLCLFEESDLLRVRLSYSGTSTGYDFEYNFTDIQFIELL